METIWGILVLRARNASSTCLIWPGVAGSLNLKVTMLRNFSFFAGASAAKAERLRPSKLTRQMLRRFIALWAEGSAGENRKQVNWPFLLSKNRSAIVAGESHEARGVRGGFVWTRHATGNIHRDPV